MQSWYRVVVRRGHVNPGNIITRVAYLFAEDTDEVTYKFRNMTGIKKKYGPEEVRPLTEKQALKLESIIRTDPNISLMRAKNKWYYVDNIIDEVILRSHY